MLKVIREIPMWSLAQMRIVLFVYLCVYVSFIAGVSSSHYVAWNNRAI
jgi:hypothetical protein